MYYKAKTMDIKLIHNDKTGDYLLLVFNYLDEQKHQTELATKPFFINSPNEDLKKKAGQVLWKMKSYFGDGNADNSVLLNRNCFISITKNGTFNNATQVYFLR